MFLDEVYFPSAVPLFHALFARYGLGDVFMQLVIHQLVDCMPLCVAGEYVVFVLPDTPG